MMVEADEKLEEEINIARVSIGLAGEEMDPDEVTKIVGITPSSFHRKGERYWRKGRLMSPSCRSVWELETEGENVAETLQRLLVQLEGKLDVWKLAIAKTKAVASASIWWEPDGGQGGFTVPSALLQRFIEFGERLDVYFPG